MPLCRRSVKIFLPSDSLLDLEGASFFCVGLLLPISRCKALCSANQAGNTFHVFFPFLITAAPRHYPTIEAYSDRRLEDTSIQKHQRPPSGPLVSAITVLFFLSAIEMGKIPHRQISGAFLGIRV